MSHSETDTNVSSLLMQAARSAAIEDGVVVPDAVSLPPPTGTTIRDSMATGGHDTCSSGFCGGGNGGALEKSSGAVVGEMRGGVDNRVGGASASVNTNANATTNTVAAIVNVANKGTSELSLIKNADGKQTNDMMSGVATAAVAAKGIASTIAIPPSVSSITTGSVNPNNNGHSSSIITNNNSNTNTNNNNKHHSTSAGTAAHLASSLKVAETRSILSSNHNNNNNCSRSGGSTSNDAAISVPVPGRILAASSPPSLVPPAVAATVSSSSSSSNRTANADVANANGSTTSGGGKKKGPPLRRGKWSAEEEAYANRLIMEFKAGLLPLTDGTTLRTFLSKLLNCDPMRISKKFVGNNCIGKQVFRRRTADINRLTPEQIQQNRAELSELERRFLDKVAQTNRMKTSGVNNTSNNTETTSEAPPEITSKVKEDGMSSAHGLTPPWLRPPNGFKHGTGAATAAAHLSSGSNRAAMAGRALLQGYSSNAYSNNHVKQQQPLNSNLNKTASAGLLALMELQQRQGGGGSNLLSSGSNYSASNFLAAAVAEREKNNNGGNSMLDLMLKSGLSRDQLNQLVNEHRDTSNSLSDMLKRQSSLDALMSLDFQSLQSIDNLANLIQNGRANQTSNIMGTKNWQPDSNSSANHLAQGAASIGSNSNLSNLANARRLQSEGRMESLIRSLSNNNFSRGPGNLGSNANFNTLLQNMQNNLGGSSNNMLNSASAFDLANMLRADSSTGLTALRMQEGLTQRNSSVDDFLSLVASGDIPHQDPHLLNIPLQSLLQQHQQNNNNSAAAQLLAQQQLLAQAANGSGNSLNRFAQLNNSFSHNNLQSNNPSNNNGRNSGIINSNSINAFGDHFSSLGNLANSNSAASLLSHYASQNGSLGNFSQYQQHNQHPTQPQTTAVPQDNNLKRKYPSSQNTNIQGPSKR